MSSRGLAPVTGDEQGRFRLDAVDRGELVFKTRGAPRFAVRGVNTGALAGSEARLVLDVGENDLTGRVLTPDDEPVAGAKVALFWESRAGDALSTSHRHALTGVDGRFHFGGLGPDAHWLRVTAPGYTGLEENCRVGEGRELVVRLWRSTP